MPFYAQTVTEAKPLSAVLREGLDDLRAARFKLAHAKGSFDQMTDAQFGVEFGFSDADDTAAKSELASGIGKLLDGDAGVTCAQMNVAVIQMLNQFG
jgi:hypothetical protein